MRNIRTNHTGLAAGNLYLANLWSMNRYYWRNRGKVEYPVHWFRRIRQTIFAALFGWRLWQLRTEKAWNRALDKRMGIRRK